MTDFVDRLLGLGGAPPIRPMVPSLFEPVVPVAAEPPLPMNSVSGATQQPPGALHLTPAGPAEPSPPKGTSGESSHEVRNRQGTVQPQPADEARAVTGSMVPVPVAASPLRQAPIVRASACPPADIPARASDGLAQSSGTEPVHAVVQAGIEALPTPAPHKIRAPETESTTMATPLPTPGREPVPVAHVSGAPKGGHPVSAGVPRYPVVHPVPPTPPLTRSERSSPPDVHISIGRIEIKGVTQPAAPPPPEQRKQPVLSLDDYLSRRTGGDRR